MFEIIDFLIVNPIVNILFFIYNLVGDYGIAIILFTCLIKILMWPLVKNQLHQTKLMRKIQPELTEIRKRCNGNKQLESFQTMDLYKRYNIKPMRSIWTLLIQLPIFFALFLAIRTIATPTIDVNVASRAYPFTRELSRVEEIIQKQDIFLANAEKTDKNTYDYSTYDFKPQLFGVVDLSAGPGFGSLSSFIILAMALLAVFMQYVTSRIQLPAPKKKKGTWKKMVADAKAGKDPDPNDMNDLVSGQMTFMMPLMMLILILNFPGAIVLYYLTTNTFSVIQYKIAMNHIDRELDDATDKAILRELKDKTKKVQEAEIIENKKTGTRVTRISARDAKASSSKSHHDSSPKNKNSSNTSSQPDAG